ncbi:MAG: transcription termination factor NusA [Candidatus Aminicenantes bacterium]|nr:transcription termination factor NusA [Candidatus Aminicenantes bacterium]
MKINVWNTILQLNKERGVETSVIIAAIEESLRVAAARHFTHQEEIRVDFRPEKGELRVYVTKTVAEEPVSDPASQIGLPEARDLKPDARPGDSLEIDIPSDTLGRIAAQAAKQVILQKFRDAEQEKVYHQFVPLVGEIVTGVVRRLDHQAVILDVLGSEVVLALREMIPGEDVRIGDKVKAVLLQVQRGPKGPQIYASRSHPKFLLKLLEIEVPEIGSGAILIKDVVRQPGERAKAAVMTPEKDIDPVGACIGVKGNRILTISKELGGEKIDIIEWSDHPAIYAKAALSPAKVDRIVVLNREAKVLQALVAKDQLSLAIGKKGINVKLASRLVGWKIEIKEN